MDSLMWLAVVDRGPVEPYIYSVGNFMWMVFMFLMEWFWMIAPVIGIVLGAVIFRLVQKWYKEK